MSRPSYEHTQTNVVMRIGLMIGAVLTGTLVLASFVAPAAWNAGLPAIPLLIVSLVLAVTSLMTSLTVRVDQDALRLRFGPGWPRRTVPLQEIQGLELTRTRWTEGMGLHLTSRGWLYNVGGRDVLLVRRAGGKAVLVGSDEPRRLRSALQAALERAQARR